MLAASFFLHIHTESLIPEAQTIVPAFHLAEFT